MTPEELTEIEAAVAAGLQPECPICGAPLIIWQPKGRVVEWRWSKDRHCFIAECRGSDWSDEPYCAHCESEDWDFKELLDQPLFEDPLPGDAA